MQPWKVLDSRYLLERWWMKLRQDRVRLPDGHELDEFHVVEYPDWASVLCVTEAGEVVFVEQYRHGVGRTSLELPAGAVDPGEGPLQSARRELLEETGFAADDWTALARWAPEPSKHDNYAHLFVARGARRVQPPSLDAAEDLRVRLVPLADVDALIADGTLFHAVHVAQWLWARARGLV